MHHVKLTGSFEDGQFSGGVADDQLELAVVVDVGETNRILAEKEMATIIQYVR